MSYLQHAGVLHVAYGSKRRAKTRGSIGKEDGNVQYAALLHGSGVIEASARQAGSANDGASTRRKAAGSEAATARKRAAGNSGASTRRKAAGSDGATARKSASGSAGAPARRKAADSDGAATRKSTSGSARASASSSASSSSRKAKAASQPSSKAVKADGAASAKQQASSRSQGGRNTEFDDFFADNGKQGVQNKAVPKKKTNSSKSKTTKRKKTSKLKRLMQLIFIGACLLLSWCLFAYYVIIFNEQQDLHKADAGIILGAALWNEQPSPALRERLDYAIELYEQGLVEYLILSGGKPSYSRGMSEAEGMQRYLVNAGIAEDKLLLETQSSDTYENLLFSQRVAEKHQLSSTIIITHSYHTKRAEDIARYVGLQHVQTAGVTTKVLNESYHYTREMLAFTKWQLNKIAMPLGMNL